MNRHRIDKLPNGQKFWRGTYFGGLIVLRAIIQYFIRQKVANQCEIMACVLGLQLDAPV